MTDTSDHAVSGSSRGWLNRNTRLLALASLFADTASEMLFPVLPIFMTTVLHASGSMVGLVDGIAQASQNIVQVISGRLSDRLGRRKPLALFGYGIAAVAKPLIGMASGWPLLLAARSADRLGSGIRSAPRDALLAGSVSERDRGKAFGLEGIGDNLGAFIGPLLALLLLTVVAVPIRMIFLIALFPAALAFLMVLLVREDPSGTAARHSSPMSWRGLPSGFWRYLAATAVFSLGNSSNAFLILQTQEIGASISSVMLIYAGYNLVAALVSYPAGALSDRLGRRWLLAGALAVFVIAYLGFALSRSILVIGALFIAYGVFQGVYRTVGKALAADFLTSDARAGGLGLYSSVSGLMQLAASLIAGMLWDRLGHSAVFVFGAFFAALGMVAVIAIVDRPSE